MEDVLNRIEIFLNFLAGFLLSPQLISLDRINRVESWEERWMQKTTDELEHRFASAMGFDLLHELEDASKNRNFVEFYANVHPKFDVSKVIANFRRLFLSRAAAIVVWECPLDRRK